MADNSAEVKIGANTTELASGMSSAEANVKTATSSISDAFARMNSQSSASVRSLNEQTVSGSSSMVSSIGKVTTAIAGMTAAYFSLSQLKSVATDASRYEMLGAAMEVVGKNAGFTVEQLNYVAKELQKNGISMIESRQQVMRMVDAQLDLNLATQLGRIAQDTARIGNINSSEAFSRLIQGIRSGEVEILRNIGITIDQEQAFKKYKDTMNITGRELTAMEKIQARANAVLEDGAKKAGVYEASLKLAGGQILSMPRLIEDFKVKMGLAFGPAMTESVKAMNQAWKDLQVEISKPEAQNAIASLSKEVSKLIVQIAQGLPDALNRALGALDTFVSVLRRMPSEFVDALGMGIIGRILFGAGPGKIIAAITLVESALDRFHLSIKSAIADWKEGAGAMQNIIDVISGKRDWSTGAYKKGTVAGYADIAGLAKAEQNLLHPPNLASSNPNYGKDTSAATGKAKAEKAPESMMAIWEEELKRKQIKEEQWFGLSLEDERAFWEKKLQIASQKNNDYNSVVGKYNDTILKEGQKNAQAQLETLKEEMADTKSSWSDRLKSATQYADLIKKLYVNDKAAYEKALKEGTKILQAQEEERKRIQQDFYETKQQLSAADIEMERESLSTLRSMGYISSEQEIATLRSFADREYAIELEKVERFRTLLKDKPEEVARINNQIELLEKNHTKTMHSLDLKAVSESTAVWRSIYSSLTSSVSSAIQSMITGATSFKQAMLNLSKSVLNTFIDMGVRMAADWLFRQITMTTITVTQNTARSASTMAATATTAAITTASATSEITKNAAVAASGAAASEASIPYVGPALAAAAAAAMLALVLGFTAMASAAGGWGQIPEDQIMMAHKNEMVLPADIAGGLRSMIASGNRPGVSSTSKTNINIRAFDAKDVVKTMKRLKRNNSLA